MKSSNDIYEPSDDSFLLANFLEDYLKKNTINSYLDMGTGSGILTKTASKYIKKENILSCDINNNAVINLKKQGFNSINSDLFKEIKQKFDLITFNAPYLPKDPREPKESRLATTGGKTGDEISLRFLRSAKSHLNKKGKIFLLISSLTPFERIKEFKPQIVKRKKIFMEELLILGFKN